MNRDTIAYLIRRTLMLGPLLIGLSILMFALIHAAPGDPTVALMGVTATHNQNAIEQTRKRLGLDKPLPEQYAIWLKNIVKGDFGTAATFNNRPVLDLVKQRFWTTVQLQGLALLISLLLAIPIGIISATRQYSVLDNVVTVGSFLGISLPNFWLALLLQIWVGVKLHWLPVISTNQANVAWPGRLRYFILPVIVLVLPQVAYFARFMRSSMLEVINQDYVTVARAKGLPPNAVLYSHALRNALIPMITVIGLQLPQILSGAVIIEQIFAWPGLGDLAYKSIGQRDYPVILAVTLLAGAAVLVVNSITDFIYVLADPRVSLAGRE
jgi:peptide/nickel transport system permease protein